MEIGIGLPASIPGVKGDFILEWARRADAGPFSSLGIIDRIVYANYEPLIALAGVAGVTQRIRLITTVLVAPVRSPGLLAKQAASLDALSGGRLTLGLGVGGREDEFEVTETSARNRGRYFERQLETIARLWSGEPFSATAGRIGPPPVQSGGPEVLIGAYTEAAIKRVGHWNNGFISGSRDLQRVPRFFRLAEQAWQEAGRTGRPRLVGCSYYGLGPNATKGIAATIVDYYSYMGASAQQFASSIASTPAALTSLIKTFEDAGADEFVLWPCIPELDQMKRLEDLISV